MNGCNSVTNKHELWKIICESSFVLDDIKLYLDTHPCDQEALKCYEEYKKIRELAVDEYTRHFGPISAYDVDNDNKWQWIEEPWPWEGRC